MIGLQIGSREQGNVMNVAMCDILGGSAQDFNKGQSSQQQSQHMNSSCIQGRQPQREGNLKQKRLRDELDKAKARCKEEFMH